MQAETQPLFNNRAVWIILTAWPMISPLLPVLVLMVPTAASKLQLPVTPHDMLLVTNQCGSNCRNLSVMSVGITIHLWRTSHSKHLLMKMQHTQTHRSVEGWWSCLVPVPWGEGSWRTRSQWGRRSCSSLLLHPVCLIIWMHLRDSLSKSMRGAIRKKRKKNCKKANKSLRLQRQLLSLMFQTRALSFEEFQVSRDAESSMWQGGCSAPYCRGSGLANLFHSFMQFYTLKQLSLSFLL